MKIKEMSTELNSLKSKINELKAAHVQSVSEANEMLTAMYRQVTAPIDADKFNKIAKKELIPNQLKAPVPSVSWYQRCRRFVKHVAVAVLIVFTILAFVDFRNPGFFSRLLLLLNKDAAA